MFSFLDTEMASLQKTREALFIGHASGFITDAEFLLLHQENSSDNLDFPYDKYPRFSYFRGLGRGAKWSSRGFCRSDVALPLHHISRVKLAK